MNLDMARLTSRRYEKRFNVNLENPESISQNLTGFKSTFQDLFEKTTRKNSIFIREVARKRRAKLKKMRKLMSQNGQKKKAPLSKKARKRADVEKFVQEQAKNLNLTGQRVKNLRGQAMESSVFGPK